MQISSQVVHNADAFDVIAKSLLLGFSRPANAKQFGPNFFVDQIAVFGTTEASALAYVKSAITGKIPDTINCVGADTQNNAFSSSHFCGTVLMLPELAYVSDQYSDLLALRVQHLLEISSGHLPAPLVGHKDLHIIFAKRETEEAILGALFEQFKTQLERQADTHFEIFDENPMYGRKYRVAAGSCGGTPPVIHQLDPHAIVNYLLFNRHQKNHYRVDPGFEIVSFGEDFACFDSQTLCWMFDQFNHCGQTVDDMRLDTRRKIMIHDKLAAILFKQQIEMARYFRREPGLCTGNQKSDTKEQRIKAAEFAKK